MQNYTTRATHCHFRYWFWHFSNKYILWLHFSVCYVFLHNCT